MCLLIHTQAQYKLDHTVMMRQHPLIAPKQTSMRMINWLLCMSIRKRVHVDVLQIVLLLFLHLVISQGSFITDLWHLEALRLLAVSENRGWWSYFVDSSELLDLGFMYFMPVSLIKVEQYCGFYFDTRVRSDTIHYQIEMMISVWSGEKENLHLNWQLHGIFS